MRCSQPSHLPPGRISKMPLFRGMWAAGETKVMGGRGGREAGEAGRCKGVIVTQRFFSQDQE